MLIIKMTVRLDVRLKTFWVCSIYASLWMANVVFARTHQNRGNCPSVCTCSQDTVDCSGKEMKMSPKALPRNTRILNLKSNKLTSVHTEDFKELESLTEIYLDDNKFSIFPDLGSLPNLRVLSISRNAIENIPAKRFDGLPSLKYLNLDHNNITTFEEILEIFMPELTHLKMNHNKLTSLFSPRSTPRYTGNYKAVERLELEYNQISRINFIIFFKFPSVKTLFLGHNKLQSLSTGALVGLKHIEELYLEGNELEVITNAWLYEKTYLKKLDLHGNFIRAVDQQAFAGTPNLEYLDLSNNRLDTLGTDRFTPLRRLKILLTSENRISSVAERAFNGLGSLTLLNLSCNVVSLGQRELDRAFSPLVNLRVLDLSNNSIMLIPKTAFRGLKNLVALNLSANNIVSIQEGAFSDMPHLKLVSVHAPKLICDCTIRWFRNWVENRSLEHSATGKCESPVWLSGKDIFKVEDRDFVCASAIQKTIKPEIIVHPKTQAASYGSNVTLRCVAISSEPSPMRMEWFKGSRLVRDKIIKTWSQQSIGEHVYRRMTELELRDVKFKDAGKYRCHVSNRFGTDWSKLVNLTIFVYPHFSERPKDVVIHSGETVQIQCSADGVPAPTIRLTKKFNKDDFPAVEEKRFWFYNDNQRFGIRDLKIKDSGYYVCRASNPYGDINATMVLTVYEEPKFVRPMGSKSVVIGSTAVLECIATGNPRPRVRWYKDGKELDINMHQRFTLSDQLLIILSTRQEDRGIYSCKVSNNFGVAEQKARLIVVKDTSQIPTKGDELPPKRFVGIIIITIVCVTILTSLVWVILICVCKARRMRKLAKRNSCNSDGNRDTIHSDLSTGLILRADRDSQPSIEVAHGQGNEYVEPLIRPNRTRFKVGIGEPILLRPSILNEESSHLEDVGVFRGGDNTKVPEHRRFISDISGRVRIESGSNGNIRISSSSGESENVASDPNSNRRDPRIRDNSSSGSSGIDCDPTESEQILPLLKSKHLTQPPGPFITSDPLKLNERVSEQQSVEPQLTDRSRSDRMWSDKLLLNRGPQTANKALLISDHPNRSSIESNSKEKEGHYGITLNEPSLPKSTKNYNPLKKKSSRRAGHHSSRQHELEHRDDFFSAYITSSSGIESGESSSSSETVSVSNLEVLEEQASAVV